MELRTSVDIIDSLPVLTVSGSVDLATLPDLQDALLRLVVDHPGQRIVVDLDGVDALDDTGLGVLLGATGRTRQAGGDLVVVCTNARLRERFAVTGLDRAVSVAGGIAELLTT